MKTYFTSESVTEGHPDKVCDRIADAILDETLRLDPLAHVACEVATTTNMIHVMGEITAQGAPAYADVIKRTVREIGYDESNVGFSASEATILLNIHEQSPDIARGVLQKEVKKQGAGDQGIVFGYACSETPSLMPLSFELATLLCQRLAYVRRMRAVPFLRPDGKAQVTLEYENGVPKRIDTVVLSAQHTDTVSLEELRTQHRELPHGGFVIRNGHNGPEGKYRQTMEFRLDLDSNPYFTGSVLAACGRAVVRLSRKGETGCRTILDIPPALLSPLDPEELRREFV